MTWIFAAWRWIASSRAGQLAGLALGALLGAWVLIRHGRSLERAEDEAQDAKDYRDERKQIDEDLHSLPSNDNARRRELLEIANRRGGGKD